MAGLSDHLENALLDWWLRNQTLSIPATCYLRLFSSNPNWETGSGGTEMVATGYTQYGQAYTMASGWTVAAQGSNGGCRLTNATEKTWDADAADWESIAGIGPNLLG